MCLGRPKVSAPPPPAPPPPVPPPPVPTAAVVQPASKRGAGSATKRRRGTAQLTVRRPSIGGYGGGSGVNVPK